MTESNSCKEKPVKKKRVKKKEPVDKKTYTIPEFCDVHNISCSTLYKLLKAGLGPRIMKAGRRTLISFKAAEDWRIRLEADSKLSESPKQAQRRDAAVLMGGVSHVQR